MRTQMITPSGWSWIGAGFGKLAEQLRQAGARRILVVSGPSRRFVDPLVTELAAYEVTIFDGAKAHVPVEVVEAAELRLREVNADTVIAIGGGSAIGLGKALTLRRPELRFVAVPTTYAGSEMTTMYGVTTGADKQTGRDARVRPDHVVYNLELASTLPIALTVQSLCNALAHVISVLSTGSLDGEARTRALDGAQGAIKAIDDLLISPTSLRAREAAQRAASECANAFDAGKPGVQHALAHLLGGALRVDHAALHALLLPHFVAHVRASQPALVDEVETAIWPAGGRPALECHLHDTLVRAGAPVALTALSAAPITDAVDTALATRSDLPAAIVHDAMHGLRPPGRGGRLDLGSEPHALVLGCAPEHAKTIVLALHGRGAEAGTIARRLLEIAGHDPHVCVVGLRAEGGANRWYEVRYGEPGAGSNTEVLRAIARVETAIAALAVKATHVALPPATHVRMPSEPPGTTPRIVLAGFSQGACLALEVAARTKLPLAAVIAPCGARVGQMPEWQQRSLDGLRVLVGAAAGDKWISRYDLDTTIAWFHRAGAQIENLSGPGDKHEITLRQRLRARELILGAAPLGQIGFGNAVTSEALPDAVPAQQNTPRLPHYGLYPEQLSGTGFTADRAHNRRTWLYRVRPGSQRRAARPIEQPTLTGTFDGAPAGDLFGLPPLVRDDEPRDFVDGLFTVCGAGSAALRRGFAFHLYTANRSMEQRALCNADGDLLLVPELGTLHVVTELGPLDVAPGCIAVIPHGLAFSVLLSEPVRGYVAEPFGRHFRLPERGLVGANGLADERHFRTAHAWYEDRLAPDTRVVHKLGGRLHEASQDHSPFDVVAWHGNCLPWVYDLESFSPVANTRFDHGDPSIYTVLTAPLDEQGAHALDFVVFPPRTDATTGTFRPPFFHRNVVSEINGIIREAVHPGSAFVPGCTFVTPCLIPHGVSGRAVEQSRAIGDAEADAPTRLGATGRWFQLESVLPPVVTPWARERQIADWPATWGSHRSYFSSGGSR